ncbi:magnesium-translocating P-type ATPase [Noviherbaspirillum pedocola]|uniref:Magnesium-transporting ATPase, P-type 1 n=1 Tax=Noviherbaspirillum pedocola TaxID=2801341 RepID=A0A934SXQ7_9BURK|nr:magnesium-translocating P-type ATPase [Noviherbaspirillum pedocola]MBK4737599.1 magnesium-translocating P-type ATPase [Noviherbaspirillum pedocola]
MPDPATTPIPFWRESLDALTVSLASHAGGLSEEESRLRLQRTGPNLLREHARLPLVLQYLAHFRNPLVMILLAASAVSALTGEFTGSVIIWIIVFMSVTLDFVQEYRADQAAERLKQTVSVQATVLREGTQHSLPMAMLVPGDVVVLMAGALIPADCILLEARDLFVNQALLTGESWPVEKRASPQGIATEALNAASNALFMGTSVLSGFATAMVCRTGKDTVVAGIADSLIAKPPASAFERGSHSFGMLILRLTMLLVLFVFLVNALLHRPFLESFLFALALAVGLTPELLPMVITVTLSRGALRMAKRHVIVKRLAAIHDLGSMDVLCTDKTGTLTEARIRLDRHLDIDGNDSDAVLRLAYLNSHFETGLKSPLDDAILEHADIDVSAWRKIDEVPFDFERRRVSVLVDDGRQRLLVVKGAPEDILRLSVETGLPDGALQPLDDALMARVRALHDALERDGHKLLAIAWRRVAADHPHAVVDDETELVFCGFAAFIDPAKDSAAHALKALMKSHVDVKILTGDSELVTRHLCARLDLAVTGVLHGEEIDRLDDRALAARLAGVNLLCRVTPIQKNRAILALKAQGRIVGFLGDGINDAPSLHSADVGISVDSAVDVAKAAADIVLMKHELGVLHDGVLEGRRTFINIMKYIMMGTSSNFGNMFSMAGATLFLPFLPMLPTQILANNLLYDLSELPIPMDRVDVSQLAHPRHWDTRFIRNFMWTLGPVSSVFDFLTFFLLLAVFHADERLFHTGWFVESIATQVLVIFVIRTRGSPLVSKPSRALAASSIAVVLIAALLPATPLGAPLGFVPPPPLFYLALAAMVLVYLAAAEAVKRFFYRRLAASTRS